MQIVNISSSPNFKEATDTYAVSFVALHLFTAGVALSILTSLDPLSLDSYESKMGLRQLIGLHSQLKSKSIVAEQSLEILKKLTKTIMAKETDRMLQVDMPLESTVPFIRQRMENERQLRGPTQQRVDNARITAGATSNDKEGMVSAPPTFMNMQNTASVQLDFCEDPLITQALSEFEQS
ncbi:tall aerial hyphae-4 [Colletotrichum tofieldiae]|nr:tall aerial hyphae-4 [Colletotrichum tofieldiae]